MSTSSLSPEAVDALASDAKIGLLATATAQAPEDATSRAQRAWGGPSSLAGFDGGVTIDPR